MAQPVMYLFLNKGLGMSTGKAAAQAAHAACLAVEDHYQTPLPMSGDALETHQQRDTLYREWMDSGHYTKLVLELEDSVQMHTVQEYLKARGYKTYLVIDEGRTENTAFKPTAMAVEIVDKDELRTAGVFGEFKLYKEKKKDTPRKGLFGK